MDILQHLRVLRNLPLHLIIGMEHGGVIPSGEVVADGVIGKTEHFINQIHTNLPGNHNLPLANTTTKLARGNAIVISYEVNDVIGIPLFSPEVLYAVSPKLMWTPRVDGLVLAQEMKM